MLLLLPVDMGEVESFVHLLGRLIMFDEVGPNDHKTNSWDE